MKITVNLKTGQNRKALANIIGQVLNKTAKYSGTGAANGHRFAYEIGGVTLTKENEIIGFNNIEWGESLDLMSALDDNGYENNRHYEDYEHVGYHVPEPEPATDNATLAPGTIWVPWMEPDEFAKLEAIVAAKHDLICKAIGKDPAEGLEFIHAGEGEEYGFAWFTREQIEYNGEEYMRFVKALCDLAANVHRVTAKPRPVPNEKYAFRVFLLRLGFIGPEYASARKLLLTNLTGNSAFRQPKEVNNDERD